MEICKLSKDIEIIETHVEESIKIPEELPISTLPCIQNNNNIDNISPIPLEILEQLKAPQDTEKVEKRKEVKIIIKKRPRKDDHLKKTSIIEEPEPENKLRRSSRLANKK
jgi:hypothetical protein